MAAPMLVKSDELFEEIINNFSAICKVNDFALSAELCFILKDLTEQFRKAEIRNEYERIHQYVNLILQNCNYVLKTNETVDVAIETAAEAYRCLRNAFAGSPQNQNCWIRTPESCKILIELLITLLDLVNQADTPSNESGSKIIVALRCGVQCLGNLVTNNIEAKRIVWDQISRSLYILLKSEDVLLSQYSCMLIYNCLFNMPDIRDQLLLDAPFACNLLETLCNLMKQDIEWSLYTIEYLVESINFFLDIFSRLPEECRFIVLDIVTDRVSKAESLPVEKAYSQEVIQCLTTKFLENSDNYILKHTDISSCFQGVQELVRILGILCSASACHHYREWLQSNTSLLISTLYVLKAVQMAGQQENSLYKPVGKVMDAASCDVELNPVFGFKRDLVRLIGNLCWKHRANQDRVREMEGIPLLLDCTRIDAKNPFITQWVVFAVRNLCEGNQENKAIIGGMKREGTVDATVLNELGVDIQNTEEGHIRVRGKFNKSQDEIDDLFS